MNDYCSNNMLNLRPLFRTLLCKWFVENVVNCTKLFKWEKTRITQNSCQIKNINNEVIITWYKLQQKLFPKIELAK